MPASHVQTVTAEGASTSASVTLTTTAGNGVIVTLLYNNNKAAVGTITQTSGDTVGSINVELDSGGTYTVQRNHDNVAGGSTTFTFTATSQTWRIYITEWSGQFKSGSFDKSAKTNQASTSTPSSGTTGTLSQSDEFAVAVWNGDSSGETTVTSYSNSFTSGNNDWGAGETLRGSTAWKVIAGTSGVQTTLTLGDPATVSALIGTYKADVPMPLAWIRA